MRSWLALFLCLICSPALAGFHGGGVTNAWNGGLVQSQLGDQPAFPFTDFTRSTGSHLTIGASTVVDERTLNANGYPDSFTLMSSAGCSSAGSTPWRGGAPVPTTYRSGTMQMQWTGCAYIHLINGATILSGQYGQNACSGSCRACTYVDSTHLYGTDCWLQFSSTAIGGSNPANYEIDSVGDGTTDPQLTDVNVFFTADAALMANCLTGRATSNLTLLVGCFNPVLISDFKNIGSINGVGGSNIGIGVVRFINVMGQNITMSAQSSFEENTPLNYVAWTGNIHHTIPSELAAAEIQSTANPAEFTLSFPGLTINDRTNFSALSSVNISTLEGTITSPVAASDCSGTPITCTYTFSGGVPSGVVDGMLVDNQHNVSLPTNVVTNVTGTTISVQCTNGPSPISACQPLAISGGIGYFGAITPGSGGTPGTYTAVPITGGSGTTATATIVVNGSGQVSSVTPSGNPSGKNYVVGDSVSALSANIGGVTGFSVLVGGTGITIYSGENIFFSPMLSVNGGSYVPLTSDSGGLHFSSTTIDSGYTIQFTYIASLNRFAVQSSNSGNSGVVAGWPLELVTAFANAVGANPYFNTPVFAMTDSVTTDWVTKTEQYEHAHLLLGLNLFLEGSDEVWNTGYDTYYFVNFEQNYLNGGGSSLGLYNQWYGWRIQQVAQDVSAVFGNPSAADRTKYYHVIDAYSAYDAGAIPTSASAFTGSSQDARLSYVGQGNDPAYKWVTDVAFASYYNTYFASSTTAAVELAWNYAISYAYAASPSTALIHTYLDGVNYNGGTSLYKLLNVVYPDYMGYIAAYVNAGYPIHITQYEGGFNNGNPSYNNTSDGTIAVTSVTPGNPTILNVATDNAFNHICDSGTYNLCTASGPSYTGNPTTKIVLGGSPCSLNGQDVGVIASGTTATTIAVNFDSSSGNTGCTTGTSAYDGSETYSPAFMVAVANDVSFTACELASMDAFYVDAAAQTPPVTAEFPSIYNWQDQGVWAVGRYLGSPYATPGGTIPAVEQFQASQSGPTSCSP